ncbi:ABC transporter permease [Microbacterium caowuchunii]|uniref:ABC transporter permease n=1 Tax=Microbacterium caowuchunii TaxID=2614638 RepID=UPI0012484257|nr:ABC transporter permease [Microbacterium caowuchunii]QEV99030.1 ABC transporter permease [Microbacterium caowuchunii]
MHAHLEASADGLFLVGQRPAFGAYLAESWRRRGFAYRLAAYRLVGGLLQNRLGVLWLVLKPLSMAIIYGTIFNFVIAGPARPASFVQFVIVGVFVFEFFTSSLGSGSKAVTSNAKFVQSLGFPRILLPISVVVEQAMRMVPIVVLLGILLVVFGEPITWSWLLFVPIVLMMAVFNLGAVLIVARLSVHARDVQQAIPILNRVLFYASGIFFSVDGALADHPALLAVAHVIPTYDFIAISRDVLLVSQTAPVIAWIMAPAWAIVTLVLGVIFFWRAEARYGLSE